MADSISPTFCEESTKASATPTPKIPPPPSGSLQIRRALGAYGQKVKDQIWREWEREESDLENRRRENFDNLKAVLSVRINQSGKIVEVVVVKSSGNDLFDRTAVRSVNKSGPVPPVPAAAHGSVPWFVLEFAAPKREIISPDQDDVYPPYSNKTPAH